MGAAEHAEGLLEIAVVRRRPPLSGQQRLGLGLNNRGLLDYRDRLRAVPRGAQHEFPFTEPGVRHRRAERIRWRRFHGGRPISFDGSPGILDLEHDRF